MAGLFMNCTSLNGAFDISCFDGCSVTNLAGMFQGCTNLTILDLSGLVTNNATDMSYLFSECVKLTSVTLTGLNTGNVKDMQYMFYKAGYSYFKNSGTYGGVSGGNTENNTSNLSITGMNFTTTNVQYMNNMFNLSSVVDLSNTNLSSWNVRNVKDMSYMFAGYGAGFPLPNGGTWRYWYAKHTAFDLSGANWVTSNCENFDYMFAYNNRVTTINLSKFDFSKAKTATHMFVRCEAATKIIFPTYTDFTNMKDLEGMFNNCINLNATNFGTDIINRWDIRNCYLNGAAAGVATDHGFNTYAGNANDDKKPEYIGANRIISGGSKGHPDFNGTQWEYSTYGTAQGNGPKVQIGGNGSDVNAQRLVLVNQQ